MKKYVAHGPDDNGNIPLKIGVRDTDRWQTFMSELDFSKNMTAISTCCGLDTETYKAQDKCIFGDETCPSILVLLLITYLNQLYIFFGMLELIC